MGQYQEGQWLQGSDGNVYVVRNGQPVLANQGGQAVPSNPIKVQEAQAGIGEKNASAGKTAAAIPGEAADSQVKTATVAPKIRQAQAQAETDVQKTRFNGLSPEVYNKALAQAKAADQLDNVIADLATKYTAGPGSTHGLAGIEDWFPTEANQRFNTAGNAARGIVRNALGLTGGEANTAAEAQMNLGAYIPRSGQFDGTIEDTINRLAELRDNARAQSRQTLGGIADANGNISPITVPDPWQQPYITNSGQQAAPAGSTTQAGHIPPAMQEEYNRYLAAHAGALDPTDYVRFRMGLDAKYGFGAAGAWKTYADEATKLNDAVKTGKQINATIPAPDQPLSGADYYRNNMANNPIGAAAVGALDAGGFGGVSALAGDKMDALRNASGGNAAGMMVGGMLGAIGPTAGIGKLGAAAARRLAPGALKAGTLADIARNVATDATYGGIYNGVANGDPTTGVVAGGLGSLGGNVIGRGLGAAVGGIKVSPQVEALRRLGIPLTVGRTLGRKASRIEDAMTSLPFAGDMVAGRQLDSISGFNNAAFQAAGAPINATIAATGRKGIGQLADAKSAAYRNTLDQVTIDATDPTFTQNLGQARQAAMDIPNVNGARDAAVAGIDNRISGAIDPNTATIPGRNFQEAYRGLTRTANERANGDYGYEIGHVMGQGKDALASALEAQNPGAYQSFLNANAANRNLNILADAVNAAQNQDGQLFFPSQLNRAVTSSGKKFGSKVTAAIGDTPLGNLADLGQGVIPSKLPDSGTARRLIQAGILSGLTAGGAGAGALINTDNPLGGAGDGTMASLGLLAALTLGGTKGGQKALNTMLTVRPDRLAKAGSLLANKSGYAGSALVVPSIMGAR